MPPPLPSHYIWLTYDTYGGSTAGAWLSKPCKSQLNALLGDNTSVLNMVQINVNCQYNRHRSPMVKGEGFAEMANAYLLYRYIIERCYCKVKIIKY